MSRPRPLEVRAPSDLFAELDGEMWLSRRLGLHGVLVVFNGVTDAEQRKHRFRQAIKERGCEQVVCGKSQKKPITYEQAFERLYHEKL